MAAYTRPPAPEDLRAVEELCNTAAFLHGTDTLARPDRAAAWLAARTPSAAPEPAQVPSPQRLARLVAVREDVRAYLADPADAQARAALTRHARDLLGPPRWSGPGQVDLDPPAAGGGADVGEGEGDAADGVAARALACLAAADLTGRRARLKVCRAPECRFVFYDRSPANNGTWCSMEICGARHKMRSYRTRRRP
ncbi:CGNR zinc finger domain-containing protein [Streptomonospora sp. S1-112]|uniref:CGNR zinc finger domain-containing protein n=1 Tax=Streptomonospora mangrovi TaxID=2883123 RepID=A0A9X3NI26_9ACTN|nr:CGNR zinc finger domain-containing protein [Streptomonospora mangrovi]MDA0563410.1 CGNR zinc finger domain-containing protein [Streptomonospora mangrovi]